MAHVSYSNLIYGKKNCSKFLLNVFFFLYLSKILDVVSTFIHKTKKNDKLETIGSKNI